MLGSLLPSRSSLPDWALEALNDLHAIRLELEKLNRHMGAR